VLKCNIFYIGGPKVQAWGEPKPPSAGPAPIQTWEVAIASNVFKTLDHLFPTRIPVDGFVRPS